MPEAYPLANLPKFYPFDERLTPAAKFNELKMKVLLFPTGLVKQEHVNKASELMKLTPAECLGMALFCEEMAQKVGPMDYTYSHFKQRQEQYEKLGVCIEQRATYIHLVET